MVRLFKKRASMNGTTTLTKEDKERAKQLKKALKKRLSYFEEFNQNDQKLLYCQSVKGIY